MRRSSDRRKALIDSSSCQTQRLQVKAKSQDNGTVEWKSRLETIPADDVHHCKLVVFLNGENRGRLVPRIVRDRDLGTSERSFGGVAFCSFVHKCGLHAANMHKVDQPQEL